MRLIDADAFLDGVTDRHCKDCDRRKGIKNGKYRVIYSIGDVPCRACDVDDLKAEIEDASTIQPDPDTVSRQAEPQIIHCNDCKWHLTYHDSKYNVGYALCGNPKMMIGDDMIGMSDNDYCSNAEPKPYKAM